MLFSKKCEYCLKEKTKRKDESGRYICANCVLKKKAESEPKRRCPVDGTEMAKEILKDFVIDRCPACKGVWLDGGELEHLSKLLEDESDDGSNFAMGMAVGLASGSTMNL